jgi:hypothetical protein
MIGLTILILCVPAEVLLGKEAQHPVEHIKRSSIGSVTGVLVNIDKSHHVPANTLWLI